jgi:hypothetical protein
MEIGMTTVPRLELQIINEDWKKARTGTVLMPKKAKKSKWLAGEKPQWPHGDEYQYDDGPTTMGPGRVRHPSTWRTGLIATCIMYHRIVRTLVLVN